MVFKTDFGIQDKDSGRLRGRQLAVACGCWFTSTGRPIPRLIKFQDENGELQTIQTIQVDDEEEKHYSFMNSAAGFFSTVCGCRCICCI